ncbi:MAG: trypsin-like peptidase domain-containing protein [Planctomycetota bacterium]|nr:trypsin-like peptidase domain-containing protein [Planctomycetota bacterium]
MTDPFAKSPGPRIKPIEVPGLGRPFDLIERDDGTVTLLVGRGAGNDVALDPDRFPSVSGEHARFELVGGELRVVDLGSRNGVLVNGEPVDGSALVVVGDQVRLGSVGPRFLVVGGRGLSDTVFVRAPDVMGERVETMVERGSRRTVLRVAGLLSLLVLTAAGALWWVDEGSDERARSLEEQLELAAAEIAALEERSLRSEARASSERAAREERIRALEASLEDRTSLLSSSISERGQEEARLLARIEELESSGASRAAMESVRLELSQTRAVLEATRGELDTAKRRVELLDPVNLAQARLSGVRQVRRSIVLIENRTRIRDVETGGFMHIEEIGPTPTPNFDGRGDEVSLESTGSGFCIDADGWILTNAHVIERPDSPALLTLSSTPGLEAFHELHVVFSGTPARYPARVEAVAAGEVDLAIIKIEPFPEMPWLEGFDSEAPPPEPGSDIFLFGFPLGHLAVQEGETVIASTFRGILSRNVGGQMQVDAGVHPGNSGGPITDARGRVIGIVESVQAGPDRSAVYTIGYGIPIAEARRLWPRATPATEGD